MQFGDEKSFKAQKMFSIVRNPIDVFPSFASLMMADSHSLQFNENISERFPRWWNDYVRVIAECMRFNHEYVMDNISKQIPTLLMRYEDLVLDPEKVLSDLFCFLLEVQSIEGTVVEERIKTVVKAGHSKSMVYGLKQKEIRFNKSRDMIDDRLFKDISEELKDYITFFGYSNIGLNPE